MNTEHILDQYRRAVTLAHDTHSDTIGDENWDTLRAMWGTDMLTIEQQNPDAIEHVLVSIMAYVQTATAQLALLRVTRHTGAFTIGLTTLLNQHERERQAWLHTAELIYRELAIEWGEATLRTRLLDTAQRVGLTAG